MATFLTAVGAANTAVNQTGAAWSTPMLQRQALAESMLARTTQALAYVRSNKAWAGKLPAIKQAADKVRAVRATRPKPPEAPTPGTPAVKKPRQQGNQSFGDIAVSFGKFLATLGQLTGYTPPDALISLAGLAQAKTDLDTLNQTVAAAEVAVADAKAMRRDIYDGAAGLRVRMLAIKDAVKGQYGQSSPQSAAVRGIKV